MHRLESFSSTQREGLGRPKENARNICEKDNPIEVEFSLVNRAIVSRNSGSSDSPSALMIFASFGDSKKRREVWAVLLFGKISSASVSMSDTGTPEFVNRIYTPWLVRAKGEVNGGVGVPSRVRLVYPVSLPYPRGADSLTRLYSVRC